MTAQKPTTQSNPQAAIVPQSNISLTIASPLRQIRIPFLNKPLTTPQIYQAAMYWIVGSSILLTGTIAAAVMSQRSVLKTVGFETTPSIYHAQRIRDSVADMDANVANLLLVPTGQNLEAEKVYQARKAKLSTILTRAAQNISIPAEQPLIIDLSLNINNYIEKIQAAKVLHSQNKTEDALQIYREAQEIVDKTLMPKAEELDQVNFQALKKKYGESELTSTINKLLVLLCGILLLGSLIGCQILLIKWTKRRFNTGLLIATIVSLLFVSDTVIKLTQSSALLKDAKEGAFDSLHALRKARSIAYSLNADESRYLLDSKNSTVHQDQFFTKVDSLARFTNGPTPKSQATNYSQQLRQLVTNSPQQINGKIEGLFADQFRNVTFRGEQESTQAMAQTFLSYFDIDRQIRTLALASSLSTRKEAIELCIGKSNDAFESFLEAHQKVMDINIDAFNTAIYTGLTKLDVRGVSREILLKKDSAQGSLNVDVAPNGDNQGLDFFWIKALLVTGTIAGFTIYGLRSRIAEYEI
jgi:hypothetical protein